MGGTNPVNKGTRMIMILDTLNAVYCPIRGNGPEISSMLHQCTAYILHLEFQHPFINESTHPNSYIDPQSTRSSGDGGTYFVNLNNFRINLILVWALVKFHSNGVRSTFIDHKQNT